MRKLLLLILLVTISGLTAQAQFRNFFSRTNWFEGHYYDLNNIKVSGLLSDFIPEKMGILGVKAKQFDFKKDKSEKRQEIKLVDVKSIVVRLDSVTIDSFVVSKSPLLTKAPLLKVIFDRPEKKFKLYNLESISRSGNGGFGAVSFSYSTNGNDYYYGTTPDDVIEFSKKSFKEVMLEMFGDEPEIAKLINNGTFKISNTEKVITHYYRIKEINARLAEQAASK